MTMMKLVERAIVDTALYSEKESNLLTDPTEGESY
jgi:hypothetical protein